MVNEVESILNEIRERVRADHEQAAPGAPGVQVETVKSSLVEPHEKSQPESTESLSRLSAHLTTTARAWDRLPPMFSNRKGGAARLELWIKARLKSMSRWFTWEQVNFNSAVHHALSETLNAQTAHEHELARLRAELSKEIEARREQHARNNSESAALRASLDALATEIRKRDANLEGRSAAIEARSATIEARSAAIEARAAETAAGMATEMSATRVEISEARTEMTSRLAELAGELRESDEQLRAEQRVCFKQLSLEASETTVMEDRGRRVIESRLDKLEKAASDGKG